MSRRVATIDKRIRNSPRMPISSTRLLWKSKRCNPFKRVSRWVSTLRTSTRWRRKAEEKERARDSSSRFPERNLFRKANSGGVESYRCYCCAFITRPSRIINDYSKRSLESDLSITCRQKEWNISEDCYRIQVLEDRRAVYTMASALTEFLPRKFVLIDSWICTIVFDKNLEVEEPFVFDRPTFKGRVDRQDKVYYES